MKTTTHTGGPWFLKAEIIDRVKTYKISADYGHSCGPLRLATVPARDKEDEANAVLMWAAPELLRALKSTLHQLEHIADDYDEYIDWQQAIHQARTAINAAQGGNDSEGE